MKRIKAYLLFLISAALIALLFLFDRPTGTRAAVTTLTSLKEMLLILPPVFILLGLLDVWVPRETMVRFMGEGSGLKGGLLAFLLGSAAAGPLYVVFPIAAAFMRKGATFANILILIGAWSTTKIPMILFELSSMGLRFGLTRLALNIPVILIITLVMSRAFSKEEVSALYARVEELD
ncbi:MAG TPA: permease [Sphaerochaeta sp.]|jgi:uncharacterized membrane protein YraQ (UPF0718 family)|nr:permease [Spirochaetales bacterium]HPY12350.1 permease [Sphaerochaeta sp.]HQB90264.1 permease [Sphaerochaeta sp.]